MYRFLLKPIFFLLDAERAHYIVMFLLSFIHRMPLGKYLLKAIFKSSYSTQPIEVFGLRFPNALGLAAGFDKDGRWIDALASLGFGFIEVGTVTPLAQAGNDKPRLFRLPQDEALINRMGFNNRGVDHLVEQLKKVKNKNVIIGGNIGKNKTTPNEQAYEDYRICFEKLHDYVHYFVVNVSSPNTPGLRELQDKEPLMKILGGLVAINKSKPVPKPILLKIAPDLTPEQVRDIVDIVQSSGIDGLIVSNTTIDRSNLKTGSSEVEALGNGGLSGQPVFRKSTDLLHHMVASSDGAFPIIGVGGIHSATDALDKINAGAHLIQIYTGFIYKGPGLIHSILKGMAHSKSR